LSIAIASCGFAAPAAPAARELALLAVAMGMIPLVIQWENKAIRMMIGIGTRETGAGGERMGDGLQGSWL